MDASSLDSQESNWMRYPDLGQVELDGIQSKGKYLPKLRDKHDITIVPKDQVMRRNKAPNSRLEPRMQDQTERKDHTLQEVLLKLGLC